MQSYNPKNWYWRADDGRVFSGASQAVVQSDDPGFVAWTQSGGIATPWPKDDGANQTLASLQQVLTPYGMFCDPLTYANVKQWALATGGFTAAVAGTPRTFATDTISQGLMTGKAVRFGQANPPTSVDWQFANVGFVTIAAADFMLAAIAIADFVQATFDTLKVVLAAIDGGTITDAAGVDAAAWPANHQ